MVARTIQRTIPLTNPSESYLVKRKQEGFFGVDFFFFDQINESGPERNHCRLDKRKGRIRDKRGEKDHAFLMAASQQVSLDVCETAA